MREPTNLQELRSVLGGFSYFRKFIKNFSDIANPLVELTTQRNCISKKGLNKQQREAFQKLKDLLCEAPILAHPDFSKEFNVQTDASPIGVGALPERRQKEGTGGPVHQQDAHLQ
jgi:hypothetical protein